MGKKPGLRKPLTTVVFNVLLSLHEGPLHGYGIMMKVEEQTNGQIKTGPGAIYGTIERLKEAGLVEVAPGQAGQDGKREYRLTELGRSELIEEAQRIQGVARLVNKMNVTGEARG